MNNVPMVFDGHEVEIIVIDGKPYFNPRHVGHCLELTESAVRNHLANMNDKQVRLLTNSDVLDKDIRKLNNAGENFLTEAGVNKLIFKSHKSDAERFQDWVCEEVLPSIREEGVYGTDAFLEKVFDDPDATIKALTRMSEERKKRLLAEAQRDEAIRTKAYIGDKKVATAMATASNLSKQNNALKIQIGDSKTYKQVTAITWLSDYFDTRKKGMYIQVGKQLAALSRINELQVRKIPSTAYGEVNAYHIHVIAMLKEKLIEDSSFMESLRHPIDIPVYDQVN